MGYLVAGSRGNRVGFFNAWLGSSQSFLPAAFVVVGSISIGLIHVFTNGDLYISIAGLAIGTIAIITYYRLEWGFFVFVGLVLVFDQFAIPGFEPMTYKASYFLTLNAIFPNLSVGFLTPMEIHLCFLIAMWILVSVIKRDRQSSKTAIVAAVGLFFSWLIVSLVHGFANGGDPMISLWEVRALSYLGIMYFFTGKVIQTKEQVYTLIWICILAITCKALQGAGRFIAGGISLGGARTLMNHEDPVFAVTLFVLLAGYYVYGFRGKQRRALRWIMIPLILGFYVANRRAALASAVTAFCALLLMLPKVKRKKILILLTLFAVLFGVYLAIYWDLGGRMGQVAQMVKSTVIKDPNVINWEDYTSNIARDQENYNLSVTLKKSPILGLGFGRKYELPLRVYGTFALKGYVTHNQILWLLVKTGPVGFFLFAFFIIAFVMKTSNAFKKIDDTFLKAVCVMVIAAILNQLVVSYVDMQLTFHRNMIYLGVLMGLLPLLLREADHPATIGNAKTQGNKADRVESAYHFV